MGRGGISGAAAVRARDSTDGPDLGPSVGPSWLSDAADAESDACPELDCLRGRLASGVLRAAQDRAARLGIGADRVLIASGAIEEEAYLRALGDHLGVAFEPLDGIARALCPIDDERLIEAAAGGLVPLAVEEQVFLTVAPRGVGARRLATLIGGQPALAARFRFTTGERLTRFIMRYAGAALATRASQRLHRTWPELSALRTHRDVKVLPSAAAALGMLGAFLLAPAATTVIFELMLAVVFLAWLVLRLIGVFVGTPRRERPPRLADRDLPVYSVIVALYREAASIDALLSGLERLDYPAEKLDVIFAVEADDKETRAAIAARKTRLPLTVIPVPASGPRTKPKALNVALPFARGPFTVIYDAEDRPQPDQMRRALHAFHNAGDELACVQARLCIDNTRDNWLTGLYTAEYAGQFDVFLPGFAALRLPLPLGGSSNHFVTATLREVGAWDAHNVTEDADLGMRLARFGYRTAVIDSTTYEEAPSRIGPWLRQRTRWLKGWVQTWLVHMRRPRQLLRDLGVAGFLSFQLIVGGNVLAALVHPLFMVGMIYAAVSGDSMWRSDSGSDTLLATFYGTTVLAGYLTSAFLGWIGLMRRGLLTSAWALIFTPVHWLLLSLAAWRALWQFAVAPHRWEKTEHGLARHSRVASNMVRSLIELERRLSKLKKSGKLPGVGNP